MALKFTKDLTPNASRYSKLCFSQRLNWMHVGPVLCQYKANTNTVSTEESEIIVKSNSPKLSQLDTVIVNEEYDTLKPKPASSFYNTSIFYDELVSKFVNCMMHGGKKSASQKVMNDTFKRIKEIQLEKQRKVKDDEVHVEVDPLKIFHKAIENAKPVIGTQTMKKKGKNFQVPYPLPDNRRRFLAIKWFLTTARNRPGNDVPFSLKLSKELLDSYSNEGSVIQKKIDYHKKAEVNRAFAHYRWW